MDACEVFRLANEHLHSKKPMKNVGNLNPYIILNDMVSIKDNVTMFDDFEFSHATRKY
jgi:hypothetical protein